jgi:hypothetical protein
MTLAPAVALCLAVTLLPSVALAQPGKATGQVTVGGKPTTLTYAYATATTGFFDKKKDDVVVILSNVPLDQKAITDDFSRMDMVRAGKLTSVEVTIDASKTPISVTIRHSTLKPAQSGGSTADKFEVKTFDGKTIAGRVYRTAPGMSFADIPFNYDITFEAAIAPKAK